MTRRELRAQGEATLKDLFGSAEQTRGLANLLTEPVYGGVWNRRASRARIGWFAR